MERITTFLYMRSSMHKIAGRADIQCYWANKVPLGVHVEITEDRSTEYLKVCIQENIFQEGDTLYIPEITRLGNTFPEMGQMIADLQKKQIRLVPIRHSLSAKMVNTNFFEMPGYEQQELIDEAKLVYRQENSMISHVQGCLTFLDSPEEESLLLAVIQGKISKCNALQYTGLCRATLGREIYRKEADLLARQASIPPFTEEMRVLVAEQNKVRMIKRTQKYFFKTDPVKVKNVPEENAE